MKKILYTLCVLCCLPFGAKAQLLWEISGKGLTKPSYLFGTIHIVPKDAFLLSPELKKHFQSCQVLALETDIDLSLKEQMDLMPMMTLPEGKSLSDYMQPDAYAGLMRLLTDTLNIGNMRINAVKRTKPFFMTAVIIEGLYGKMESYEKSLLSMSKKRKMEFAELEPIASQLALVNDMSIEEQVKSISEEMTVAAMRRQYDAMIEAYKTEDLAKLDAVMNEAEGLTDDFAEKFLHQRNRNWIPVIEKLVSAKPTFIAVGAGHLGGNEGVVQLLKNAGYTLTAIPQKREK